MKVIQMNQNIAGTLSLRSAHVFVSFESLIISFGSFAISYFKNSVTNFFYIIRDYFMPYPLNLIIPALLYDVTNTLHYYFVYSKNFCFLCLLNQHCFPLKCKTIFIYPICRYPLCKQGYIVTFLLYLGKGCYYRFL